MKTILPLFVMICLCCSCSDDVNHKRILMNDGTVVTLKNSNIVHYASEQELINDIFDNYRVYAESRSGSDDAIKSERKDSVSGYTEIRYYSDWISATFGEWAKAYDFMPNEKYYIRIAGCVKELPCYSGEQLFRLYMTMMINLSWHLSQMTSGDLQCLNIEIQTAILKAFH